MGYGTRWMLLVLGIVFVSGCAATQGEWTKAGVTPEQHERDKNECMFGATEIRPGGGGVNYERYERCLADRGYTREKKTE